MRIFVLLLMFAGAAVAAPVKEEPKDEGNCWISEGGCRPELKIDIESLAGNYWKEVKEKPGPTVELAGFCWDRRDPCLIYR